MLNVSAVLVKAFDRIVIILEQNYFGGHSYCSGYKKAGNLRWQISQDILEAIVGELLVSGN